MRKIFCAVFIIALIFSLSGISCADENDKKIQSWDLDKMIHQDLKQVFAKKGYTTITPENLPEFRKRLTLDPAILPKDSNVEIYNEFIADNLRVRVYKPAKINGKLPALLWIHGGGHISATPEGNEKLMIDIVKRAKCIIAQPDYRLAPENPYPANLDDCMTTLKWLANNSQVNADKIVVGGSSSGGGLAAAVTLKARDEGAAKIFYQVLLYPMLDYRNITPSSYQIQDNRSWCRELNITAWKMYLGDNKPDIYASPALAEDLLNLPPAYIMAFGLDPFRDEDIIYAQKLMQAGVPVELRVIPRVTHTFETIFPDLELSINTVKEYTNAIVNALK